MKDAFSYILDIKYANFQQILHRIRAVEPLKLWQYHRNIIFKIFMLCSQSLRQLELTARVRLSK